MPVPPYPRTSVISARVVTDGLLKMLRVAMAPKVIYDGVVPSNQQEATDLGLVVPSLREGYGIVYPIGGGAFDGSPMWAPEADATLVYQVSWVSSEREAAEWGADRVRLTMCSRAAGGGFQVAFPVLVGAQVIHREPDVVTAGVVYDGPPDKRVFTVPERYRISVVSA